MINGKTVLSITLARGGSKKIPKKNITIIQGKPLLQYTVDEVKKSKYIDRYIVSTDSDDIKKVCSDLDVEIYHRSSENASDTARTSDALLEVINGIRGESYDYIVEVMCTNPLKKVNDIDECIEKIEATRAHSVVSVVRILDHHPSRVKYIQNGYLIDFYPEILESRRQDLTPNAYVRNGSIYVMRCETFLKTKTRITDDVRPYIMPEERSINLDELRDLDLLKLIMDKNNT